MDDTSRKPRILVSNDDGIDAPGLNALVEHVSDLGEIWVVAPLTEQSAVSHSISLHAPLRIHERGPRRFAVAGTPTDSVYMALNHLMPGPPDLVLSGINAGPNLGSDVIYSGTVSAAMEGALYGHRAIAVSLYREGPKHGLPHYDTAARFARSLSEATLSRSMPPGVVLNVNVPNRAHAEIEGVKLCRLGYNDWADRVEERHDPRGRPYYWIGGDRTPRADIEDSDNNAVSRGCVTITPIHYDLTDYRSFDYVRDLPIEGYARQDDTLGQEPLPHPIHQRRPQKT